MKVSSGLDCAGNDVSGLIASTAGWKIRQLRVAIGDVTPKKPGKLLSAEMDVAAELVRMGCGQGLALTGPDGVLKPLTKTVIETTLNVEMTEHVGYEKHDSVGRESGNIRNGTRGKTVLTDSVGAIDVEVPRDRAGTFER